MKKIKSVTVKKHWPCGPSVGTVGNRNEYGNFSFYNLAIDECEVYTPSHLELNKEYFDIKYEKEAAVEKLEIYADEYDVLRYDDGLEATHAAYANGHSWFDGYEYENGVRANCLWRVWHPVHGYGGHPMLGPEDAKAGWMFKHAKYVRMKI